MMIYANLDRYVEWQFRPRYMQGLKKGEHLKIRHPVQKHILQKQSILFQKCFR